MILHFRAIHFYISWLFFFVLKTFVVFSFLWGLLGRLLSQGFVACTIARLVRDCGDRRTGCEAGWIAGTILSFVLLLTREFCFAFAFPFCVTRLQTAVARLRDRLCLRTFDLDECRVPPSIPGEIFLLLLFFFLEQSHLKTCDVRIGQ